MYSKLVLLTVFGLVSIFSAAALGGGEENDGLPHEQQFQFEESFCQEGFWDEIQYQNWLCPSDFPIETLELPSFAQSPENIETLDVTKKKPKPFQCEECNSLFRFRSKLKT